MKQILTTVFLIIIFSVFGLNAISQGFSFNDPNVVFKDESGKVMTSSEALAFASQGTFSTKSEVSGDGKKLVTLYRPNSEEKAKMVKANYEWMFNLRANPLPAFSLKDDAGKSVSLKDYKGKVLIINFWFTQCKPCIEEMPALNKMVKENANTHTAFVAVTFDPGESVQKFLTKFPFDFKMVTDAKSYIDELKIATYPTTLIVDRKGIVRDIFIGSDAFLTTKIQVAIDQLK